MKASCVFVICVSIIFDVINIEVLAVEYYTPKHVYSHTHKIVLSVVMMLGLVR